MENIDSKVTPESEAAIADLSSYFGIRPGTTTSGTLPIFDQLPEDKRPIITIEYMTSTDRAEYAEKMAALGSPSRETDETDEAHTDRVMAFLNAHRKEHDAINEWLIKRKLLSITNYPNSLEPGTFIDIKREGKELSPESWEALAFPLRPHVARFIIEKNFTSPLETTAVKS